MTRLTKDIRDRICQSAIEAAFKTEGETLSKECDALGMEMYRAVYDDATRKAAAKMPEGWLRTDSCLRFNCEGYDLTFHVKKAVRVPSNNYGCHRLGNISGELAAKGQDWAKRSEDMRGRRRGAEVRLEAMLANISSLSVLEKTWPEGRLHYTQYLNVAKGAAVPAVQIAEINAMLGLAEAA